MGSHSTTQSAARALAPAFVLAVATTALAQQQAPSASRAPAAPATVTATAPSIVSVDRIRRQLRETPPTRDVTRASSLLKLEYYVQVVGTPPRIDFFKDFNIGRASAVQYGGMTHDEFLRITGPFWRKTW